MSGLELPGLLLGLPGLIAVFDKGFKVWKTIQEAQGFASDIAEWMCKLEMEFFRFQTWRTALEHISLARQTRPQIIRPATQTSDLQSALHNQLGQPVVEAARNIIRLLEQIEAILRRNGVLAIKTEANGQEPTSDLATPLSLDTEIAASKSRVKKFTQDLMKRTSWRTRLTHDTNFGKDRSDKAALDDMLNSIIYWNNALYSILPQNLRESILQLGIAGYMLQGTDNIGDLEKLSGRRDFLISQSAKFIAIRERFSNTSQSEQTTEGIIHAMVQRTNSFVGLNMSQVAAAQYSIVEQVPAGGKRPSRVLVEWIPFPQGDYQVQVLARKRMSQLTYSLSQVQELSTLQPLPCLGFMEYASHFGLLYTIPPDTKSSARVVTLHEILTRKPRSSLSAPKAPLAAPTLYPLPSLAERISLASTLATSFYTFLLTRWHHESFSSLHIAFILQSTTSQLDISNPIVGGFATSRPDAPSELSICAQPSDQETIYLHPDIRMALNRPPDRPGNTAPAGSTPSKTSHALAVQSTPIPRFQRAYDIYALGLLLAEIGFWAPIGKIAKADALNPTQFRDAVARKCKSDLACWMGERYRDVAVACLLSGEEEGQKIDEEENRLSAFYWDVVMPLTELQAS